MHPHDYVLLRVAASRTYPHTIVKGMTISWASCPLIPVGTYPRDEHVIDHDNIEMVWASKGKKQPCLKSVKVTPTIFAGDGRTEDSPHEERGGSLGNNVSSSYHCYEPVT